MQSLKVMPLPVTLTYPWKSLPRTAWPFDEYVWLPLTTVNAVPATTPVLPASGLPPREAGGGAFGVDRLDGMGVAEFDPDALAEGTAEELAEGDAEDGTTGACNVENGPSVV
jgi:hypothetical protein